MFFNASRGAGVQTIQHKDCKRDRLWVRFPLEEMKFHTTRNASKIQRKRGNGSVLMGTECLNTSSHVSFAYPAI